MTRKKPPGSSWQRWIERSIDEAQKDGAFDDLPGKGKPLADLDEVYDPNWWAKKLIQRERLSLLPPALALRKRVEGELRRIAKLRRREDVKRSLERLNAEIAKVNRTAAEGPPTDLTRIDVEAFLLDWERQRGES